jgi:hypothetical protein
MNMILQEPQCNITICLLENPASSTGISEEQPTTSGTNPQTLTVTLPTSQNTTVVVLPSDISPVPDTFGWKQEQPTKHEHSQKGSAAIL